MTTHLYDPADMIRPGDILPKVSRFPVARVIVHPHSHVRATFAGTTFTRDFPHGGPDFGFECVLIERI